MYDLIQGGNFAAHGPHASRPRIFPPVQTGPISMKFPFLLTKGFFLRNVFQKWPHLSWKKKYGSRPRFKCGLFRIWAIGIALLIQETLDACNVLLVPLVSGMT